MWSFSIGRVKEEKPFVPELKDIREEVIAAWKLGRAVAVAKEEAEKLAKQVKGDKPLKDSVDEKLAKQVVETNEFSWMTHGSTPMGSGAPYLSSVTGVEMPGAEFMEAVYALRPNQVGVAINRPKTVVYVVRLVSDSPPEEQRRQQFLDTGITYETFYMGAMDRQQILEQWYLDLDKEMGLQWTRPPQQFMASDY